MEHPIVEIDLGKLRGVNETNINGFKYNSFRGVPYAKPPVGKLRFKDPENLEAWNGIRDADKHADICAQFSRMDWGIIGSDDCLYLNIYTPTLDKSASKAVMVWIHGGAFVVGSGNDDFYGPDYLIDKDIVLVTINYRVGILGFLNVEDEIAPGNQGLKDQVAALKWINKYISNFGGDKNNITIFGESAGGASVHYLCLSPLSQGLFHKAILQSGVANNPWASVPSSPKKNAIKIASILGKDSSDPVEIVEFLRTIDAIKLLEAQMQMLTLIDKILFINPFGPSTDLHSSQPFLPIPLDEAIKIGIKVPCMVGYLSEEGLISTAGLNDNKLAGVDSDCANHMLHPNSMRILNQENITFEKIKNHYFDNEKITMENLKNFINFHGDFSFVLGIHDVLEIQKKNLNTPTYFYKFDYDLGKTIIKLFLGIDEKGVCHGEDLLLLFHFKLLEQFQKEPPSFDSMQHLLIQRFTKMWSNFARTGNPTPETSELTPISWKPIDNFDEYNCLIIDDKLTMGFIKNIREEIFKNLKNKL
ncbi:juvenile hormone esterase-like [Aphidius gifuensis]|uniref:juvenile hormone esterase-like n=1 Tax=Aphidius gifuensis TaxID=684658 RepID=UPI001CDC32F8|nr:juvenile hormone esterase-like [Aphidius gifuensis]